jgi:hypothetical protein
MIGYLNCANLTNLPLTTKYLSLHPPLYILTPPLTRPPHPSPNHPLSPSFSPIPLSSSPATPPPPLPLARMGPPSPWNVAPHLIPRSPFLLPCLISNCMYSALILRIFTYLPRRLSTSLWCHLRFFILREITSP